MVDLIIDNIQLVGVSCSLITTAIVVWKKKHQSKVQTVFLTTQFKTRFKKHSMHFNEQFKTNNGLFK
ncbi:MAG TPA: hypothetical protein VIK86_05755 [Candidatus Paceibacterota bacterium]